MPGPWCFDTSLVIADREHVSPFPVSAFPEEWLKVNLIVFGIYRELGSENTVIDLLDHFGGGQKSGI